MPNLVSVGNKLYRVNPRENRIEMSSNGGYLWVGRSRMGSGFGRLKDILFFHNRLFALTEKGLWRSANEGADWGKCGSGHIVESLVALQDGGQYLFGLSEDGYMYRSYNEGADWVRIG